MESTAAARVQDLRYQADERPPQALALGLGVQYAMLAVAGIVLTPAIVVRAANGSDAFLSWATFAALAVSGVTTILQAVRLGRIGAGYILLMGTSAAFIAVCVTALVDGGPGLLATLVAVSALFQFRAVQGAVTADGVGNLLSGLAATVPNTTYSSSVSITAITGVAARTVGVYIGSSPSSCWLSCRSSWRSSWRFQVRWSGRTPSC